MSFVPKVTCWPVTVVTALAASVTLLLDTTVAIVLTNAAPAVPAPGTVMALPTSAAVKPEKPERLTVSVALPAVIAPLLRSLPSPFAPKSRALGVS